MKLIDRSGQRYGHLLVIERGKDKVHPNGKRSTTWICKCDCGRITTTNSDDLRTGSATSCGCRKMEGARKALYKHGDSVGKARTRIYRIWALMKQRCNDVNSPSYANYGARGIAICAEWSEYQTFKEWAMSNGYRDDLTIDRIDVNKGYEPSNCRWATRLDQANNKRNNRRITIDGRTQTLAQWMRELNKTEYQVLKTYC